MFGEKTYLGWALNGPICDKDSYQDTTGSCSNINVLCDDVRENGHTIHLNVEKRISTPAKRSITSHAPEIFHPSAISSSNELFMFPHYTSDLSPTFEHESLIAPNIRCNKTIERSGTHSNEYFCMKPGYHVVLNQNMFEHIIWCLRRVTCKVNDSVVLNIVNTISFCLLFNVLPNDWFLGVLAYCYSTYLRSYSPVMNISDLYHNGRVRFLTDVYIRTGSLAYSSLNFRPIRQANPIFIENGRKRCQSIHRGVLWSIKSHGAGNNMEMHERISIRPYSVNMIDVTMKNREYLGSEFVYSEIPKVVKHGSSRFIIDFLVVLGFFLFCVMIGLRHKY